METSSEPAKVKPVPPPKPARTITPPPSDRKNQLSPNPTPTTTITPTQPASFPSPDPVKDGSKPKPPPPPPPPKPPARSSPSPTPTSQAPPPPPHTTSNIAAVKAPPPPPKRITSNTTISNPNGAGNPSNTAHEASEEEEEGHDDGHEEDKKGGAFGLEAMRRMTMNLTFKTPTFIEHRKSVHLKDGGEEVASLVGTLSKRNREGTFDKCVFTLTKETLLYQKQKPNTTGLAEDEMIEENECKTLPLITVMACPLRDSDYQGSEKRDRAFRLLSKQKSFILRAKTIEMRDEWFKAIQDASNVARSAAGMSSFHESDMAPIWEPNEDNCALCQKAFSFFVRKHHCRNCGACVCELCSKDKVRIPKFDEYNLYKVCNHCSKELKESRVYGFQAELT